MRCAKCDFQLVRVTLAVNLGRAIAGSSDTEPCPNGCGPLWPVTWEQYARQMQDAAEQMAERAIAAETKLLARTAAVPADDLIARLMSACRRDALTWADRKAIGEAISRIVVPAMEQPKPKQGNGRTKEQVQEDVNRAIDAGITGHPLNAYLDSYLSMASMGDGRVSAYAVAVDIQKNMMPVTAAAQQQKACS